MVTVSPPALQLGAGALKSTDHLTICATWETLFRGAEGTARGITPLSHLSMFSKETETANTITNVQRLAFLGYPGTGSTSLNQNLMISHQHANNGEVSALPTPLWFLLFWKVYCVHPCT